MELSFVPDKTSIHENFNSNMRMVSYSRIYIFRYNTYRSVCNPQSVIIGTGAAALLGNL
jgi:hypothetical protein